MTENTHDYEILNDELSNMNVMLNEHVNSSFSSPSSSTSSTALFKVFKFVKVPKIQVFSDSAVTN